MEDTLSPRSKNHFVHSLMANKTVNIKLNLSEFAETLIPYFETNMIP